VLLLSVDVPGRNAGTLREPPVRVTMIGDPQTMKAATMAMALTRSAQLHRFQSDFKSRIGYQTSSLQIRRESERCSQKAWLTTVWRYR
jgi:hypothetical protein